MILGIDASNIRFGGGVTHLTEVLNVVQPSTHGFDRVVVWSNLATLDRLPERPWLRKLHDPMLELALPYRFYWQRFILARHLAQEECDVLFVPGGVYIGIFCPVVTMSQNMLPFERAEARRFGISWMRLKMTLLRYLQIHTFKASVGLIFLTNYAQDVIINILRGIHNINIVIPHGMNDRFPCVPRVQQSLGSYTPENPLKILYVSTVDVFKHQWYVAEAVAYLKAQQLPIQLCLVGLAYPPALKRLRGMLRKIDPTGSIIHYQGPVPYSELFRYYHESDIFVFASSCENMPNILLEAMAAGLPIACSNRGPMPEILGDAGIYFDPERPVEIAEALRKLIKDPVLRAEKAREAYERAKTYSWERCARETFDFIARVAKV
jgi:glycosyltransferase involved in cell wall biosynthesis